jgi:hypothetical protein
MILHPGHVPYPAKLYLHVRGLNAGDSRLFEDFIVGNEVTPVDVEDGAEAALIEAFNEAEVTAVSDPGFGAI